MLKKKKLRRISRKRLPDEMLNSKGEFVPTANVREDHLKKHLAVISIGSKIVKLENYMQKVKSGIMDEIINYKQWLVLYNNMQDATFENLTLINYENTYQVVFKTNDIVIGFDDTIQLVKIKIDNCLKRWGEGSHNNIRTLINSVFKVDKSGVLNKNAILGLFRYEMNDREWDEAMELIRKSIIDKAKKNYLMVRKRDTIEDDWETVTLNFSSI